jgi:hypothetical protein
MSIRRPSLGHEPGSGKAAQAGLSMAGRPFREQDESMEQKDKTLVTRQAAEYVTAFAMLGFGVLVMTGALENDIGWSELGPDAGYFPFYVGAVIVIAGLGVLVQTWLARGNRPVTLLTRLQFCRIASFFLPIVGYVLLAMLLGLYVSSALYLAAVMLFQGRYGALRSVATAAGVSILLFILFEWCFQTPLLKGPLEAWLGIY